jgi:hypothetical protein
MDDTATPAGRLVLRPIASPVPVTLLALAVPIQLICMAWAFVTRSAAATAAAAILAASWLAAVVFIHALPSPSTPVPLAVAEIGAGGALLLVAVVEGAVSTLAGALVFLLAAPGSCASGSRGPPGRVVAARRRGDRPGDHPRRRLHGAGADARGRAAPRRPARRPARRRRGRLSGGWGEQLRDVESEPGVRRLL